MELLKENKSVLQIISIGISVYIIQKILFIVFDIDTSVFKINFEITHVIMLFLSVVIMMIINLIFKKNKDVVGMTFLLITSVKVAIIYFIGSYFLLDSGGGIEKWNFYGLFVLYLSLETFFTGRRLNRTSF